MCDESPDDTGINKSALEIRVDSVFGCRLSRYGKQ